MKSIKTILGGIRQADQKFSLFQEKDRILLGVSGGKDSMVLLYALLQYQRFNFVNFEVIPAILDLGFPDFEPEPIKEYISSLGAELRIIDSKDVYKILKIQQKNAKHLPCSICSRMKKAAINKVAKELGCNKVAFAHHADDAIETLFLNEIYGGRVATFQPKMHLERANIDFIRPLILIHESDIIACQKEENIPSFPSHCPNEGITMRSEIKDLVKSIYHKYPSSKDNFLTMLSNHEKECLFYEDIYYKIERKDISFKPVIKASDMLLEQKIRYQKKIPNFDENLNRFIIFRREKPIGLISYHYVDKNALEIVDFILIRESSKLRKDIFSFLEIQFLRKTYPLDIYIKGNKNRDDYLSLGYEKTHISGFFKHLS